MNPDAGLRIAALSLEPWDDVWRRNQHLASRLVSSGVARSVLFVEPPRGGLALRATGRRPIDGVEVLTPPLVVPRRAGGHRVLGRWLNRRLVDVDVLWINDPLVGRAVVGGDRPALYDVTDDWRSMPQRPPDRARLVAAEDTLAGRVAVVVCSTALADRWRHRYHEDATLIGNGVDAAAIAAAQPVALPGAGPHVVYVGTVHDSRVDVGLVLRLAAELPGTVHLVGPVDLPADRVAALRRAGVDLPGRVPHREVPRRLVAADVLICPHLVDEFTRSLDAIKAYEYLATAAPVVATPSSGFEDVSAPGLTVVPADGFVAAVRAAVGTGPFERPSPPDWDERAARFGVVIRAAHAARFAR